MHKASIAHVSFYMTVTYPHAMRQSLIILAQINLVDDGPERVGYAAQKAARKKARRSRRLRKRQRRLRNKLRRRLEKHTQRKRVGESRTQKCGPTKAEGMPSGERCACLSEVLGLAGWLSAEQ